MKKFSDYFKLENSIRILSEFNIVVGGYYLGEDNYFKYNFSNGKQKQKYDKFLSKNYNSYFKQYRELKGYYENPVIRLVYQDNTLSIIFDYVSFMVEIINDLNLITDDEKKEYLFRSAIYDPEEFANNIRYFLNTESSRYRSILAFEQENIIPVGVPGKGGLVSEYEKKINNIRAMVKNTLPCFMELIDVREFLDCFDYDKLCLIVGRSLLLEEEGAYQYQGKLCKQLHVLSHYINCVEKYSKENNINYNPKIVIDKKGTTYNFNDLKREYNELVKNDPTYSEDFFEDILADEAFPWEILSSGNKIIDDDKREQNISQNKNSQNSVKQEEVYEARKTRVIEGFNYLINLDPERTFKGLGKFEGYIGFEYKNGIVVFEKVYDDLGNISLHNATYVMNKYNFKRLSKFSKSQIMFILKQSKKGIKRIYHTENMKSWKSSIDMLINNSDYTPEDYDYIDELIALRKKENETVKKIKK